MPYLTGDHGCDLGEAMVGGFPVVFCEADDEKHGGLLERSSSGEAPTVPIDGHPAAHAPTPAMSLPALEEDLSRMWVRDCSHPEH